jgi:hypothetical protein
LELIDSRKNLSFLLVVEGRVQCIEMTKSCYISGFWDEAYVGLPEGIAEHSDFR